MEDLSNNFPVPTTPKINNPLTADLEVRERSPDRRENAEYCLSEGIECLKSGETESAIDLLSRALELATKTKGELDTSLYRFYYTYADALIINHEKENAGKMFGDLVPEEAPCSVSSSQSENEEASEKIEAVDEQASPEYSPEVHEKGIEGGKLQKRDSENIESKGEKAKEGDEESGEEESGEEESGEEGEERENREEEGEVAANDLKDINDKENNAAEQEVQEKPDDLEIAWECLESARVILKKSEEIDQVYLAKVITRLGDLLSYKEEFEKANEEYSASLQLLFTAEGPDPSRSKAELFFLIGNNYLQVKGKEIESANHFTSAIECLEAVIAGVTETGQREEIEDILREVINKREDALEQQQSIVALQDLEKTEVNKFDAPSLDTVLDLGVLGKRRREYYGDPLFPENNDDKKTIN